jgi:hypothetical protein
MNVHKLVLLQLFVLMSFVCDAQTRIASTACDTTEFKISGNAAADTALHAIYNNDFQRVDSIAAISYEGVCCWKITTHGLATNHHGYYSTTWYEVYIDPTTGKMIKQNGYKKLGDRVPDGKRD